MAKSALLVGGGGQVGRVVAKQLLERSWQVTVAQRKQKDASSDIRSVACDRNEPAFDDLLVEGFDLVVDLVAFRPEHAQQLIRRQQDIGSVVMLSSAAVYQDSQGRTLPDATDMESSPVFEQLVTEDSAAVEPDDQSYAGRKRTIEATLLDSDIPATIIRPAAIHGPNSPQPREWFYVRRLLDGRRHFVLGFGGRSSLHPCSVFNLSEMICLAADKPGDRVLNCGDPGLPDEREISAAIADAMGQDCAQVLLPGVPPIATPWSLPTPFFLATEKAQSELGYRPVATYRSAAEATCQWLVNRSRDDDFEASLDPRFGPLGLGSQVFVGAGHGPFDYACEDEAITRLVEGVRS